MERYVYKCLEKYGNTVISEKTYNELGEATILNDLKQHGFDCEIIIYEHKNDFLIGKTIEIYKDIIIQTKS